MQKTRRSFLKRASCPPVLNLAHGCPIVTDARPAASQDSCCGSRGRSSPDTHEQRYPHHCPTCRRERHEHHRTQHLHNPPATDRKRYRTGPSTIPIRSRSCRITRSRSPISALLGASCYRCLHHTMHSLRATLVHLFPPICRLCRPWQPIPIPPPSVSGSRF